MGTTAEKLTYLNETKTQLKDMLNLGGASLTTEPFRQYVDTLKNRYLYFMNNGTQQVWDNWDKVNGTGTTLSLSNTEEAPMSLTYKGNTLQNGTPTPDNPIPIQVVSGDNSIVVCGKNLLNIADSTQTINNWYYRDTPTNILITENMVNKKISLSYDIDITNLSPEGNMYGAIGRGTTATSMSATLKTTVFSGTTTGKYSIKVENVTITNAMVGQYIVLRFIGFSTPTTVTYTYSNVQLEYSETATTYKEYEGASYPISLGVENLLNTNLGTYKGNGLTIKANNGVLTINGTATASTIIALNTVVGDGSTYTLSVNVLEGSSSTVANYIQVYVPGSVVLTKALYVNGNVNGTLTSGISYSTRLNIASGEKFNNLKIQIQLEKGNTAHSFTPYLVEPIELLKIGTYQDKIDKSSGKNLFDETYYNNSSLYTKTGNFYAYIEMPDSFKTKFYGNMSLKGTAQNLLFGFSTTNNSILNTQRMLSAGTINSNIEYDFTNATNVYLIIGNGNGITLTTDIPKIFENYNIMVSTTSNEPYEPYGTRWYVKKEVGKLNLSPIPFSAFNSSANNTARIVWYSLGHNYIDSTSDLCNRLPFNINIWNVDTQGFSVGNSSGYIITRINKSIVGSTEEEANTWLSNNDLVIYAPLVTPTYEIITDNTLISQLEALKSYEGQTNISQENNDLASILDITALKEM